MLTAATQEAAGPGLPVQPVLLSFSPSFPLVAHQVPNTSSCPTPPAELFSPCALGLRTAGSPRHRQAGSRGVQCGCLSSWPPHLLSSPVSLSSNGQSRQHSSGSVFM